MAMLQLGGTLSNATVRITPRISWWITAQHLINASSTASVPNPELDTSKDEKIHEIPKKQQRTIPRSKTSLISDVFRNLEKVDNEDINQRVNSATTIDELLNLSKSSEFNAKVATNIVRVLYNWAQSDKIQTSDFQNDERYLKIYEMLGINNRQLTKLLFQRQMEDNSHSSFLISHLREEKTKMQIQTLKMPELIAILSALASKRKRSVTLLQVITEKMAETDEVLDIKQLGDTLYSMAMLNYYNPTLMEKISKELLGIIWKTDRSAVIGSILTSVGMLRYKDEQLLEELSKWILQHKDNIRPQEISSLLMTLASLWYIPKNFSGILEQIIRPLSESDMCQSSQWLDVVWSLTVLNQSTLKHYESILNPGFLSRLFDLSEISTAKTLKILNINAAATLSEFGYKGPLLPETSSLLQTLIVRTKEKKEFLNSVLSALKILLPSDQEYLNVNLNTGMGFLLDAEFCVNSQCTPVRLSSTIDNKTFRIAILSCVYNDFCRRKHDYIGPVNLHKRLLEQRGYKVLLIPYSELNASHPLVQRVKYINDNIKTIVHNSTSGE